MINNQKFSAIKKCVILFILLIIYISISAISYVHAVSTDISDTVFRLHIIANSDSSTDQELKYKIRDKVIEYMNSIPKKCKTKSEIISLSLKHIEDFKQIAKNVVKENGLDYDVTVSIGNFEFPTKVYGDISLPAGFYDALKIEIGKAQGKNWWCVMFPPLCFVDITTGIVPDDSKKLMQEELSTEEYCIISEKTPDVKFKFKLIELFSSITNTFTAKKNNF